MDSKNCKICGKEFKPTYSKQLCCCKKCAALLRAEKSKAEKIAKQCEVCGATFYVTASGLHRKYCSRECTNVGRTTQVKKICEYCGKEYTVIKERQHKTKYCSRKCSDNAKKAAPNCVCKQCGKEFHVKPYHLKKYGKSLGIYCSRKCLAEAKKKHMSGSGNHQYGLKGPLNSSFGGNITYRKNHKLIERDVYCPDHPFCSKNGRVWEHRLIVEKNYQLFDKKYFTIINGNHYLNPKISVHHKDGNHNNNDISNLMPCTIGEHMHIHKEMREKARQQKETETAVLKQGELLENPEVGNQQPSTPLTKCEGSETRC